MGSYFSTVGDDFIIVPILIRDGVRVDVRMPKDLTEAEARKVAAVVNALALKDNPND